MPLENHIMSFIIRETSPAHEDEVLPPVDLEVVVAGQQDSQRHRVEEGVPSEGPGSQHDHLDTVQQSAI